MKINTNYSLISNKPQQNNPSFNGRIVPAHFVNGKYVDEEMVGSLYIPDRSEIAGILGDSAAAKVENQVTYLVALAEDSDVLVYPKGKGLIICILEKVERSIDNSRESIRRALVQALKTESHYSLGIATSPDRVYAQAMSTKLEFNRRKELHLANRSPGRNDVYVPSTRVDIPPVKVRGMRSTGGITPEPLTTRKKVISITSLLNH